MYKKKKIEQVNVFLNGGCVRMYKIIKISTAILKCNDDLYPLEKWGCSSFAENKASSTPKFKYALCKVWLKFGPWFFFFIPKYEE